MSEPVTSGVVEDTTPPVELKEYRYYVGHIETTAMLTKEMAERMGAVEVSGGGEPARVRNNEAERLHTQSRAADEAGVAGAAARDALAKTRDARNKRAAG